MFSSIILIGFSRKRLKRVKEEKIIRRVTRYGKRKSSVLIFNLTLRRVTLQQTLKGFPLSASISR
jgi:hypothetical protein